MDREAFKQRMQSLKSYRENNPGKGYLDWKASLPDNLQDESSYNLQRAYELGYEPEYIEEDRSYHLPTRDQETGEILKKPWHPTFLIGLQEDAKLGYYPQTINGVTYTTTWEGNERPIYKYAEGGEIPPTKPDIIEPIPYKGKLYTDRYGKKYTEQQVYDYYNNGTDEIDRFSGRPLVRGLKPLVDLEDAANFTPVGDAVAAYDVYDAVSNKDWTTAGLSALAILPFVPTTVKEFNRKYRGITPKSATPKVKTKPLNSFNTSVNRNYVQDRMNEYLARDAQNTAKLNRAANQTYNVAERLMDDPEYLIRANQVKKQFGDDYTTVYADIIDKYNNDPFSLPNIEQFSNGKSRAQLNPLGNGKYNYRLDPDMANLDFPVTEHELSHYTDFKRNKDRMDPHGDSNMFYQMSKDLKDRGIDEWDWYYLKPIEQKAHMNQLREYMFQNGMIGTRGQTVDAKMMKKVLDQVSKTDSMKEVARASRQFNNINKYTKWFNSIPLLGIGAAAVYNTNQNE